jgi:hypothetical protein
MSQSDKIITNNKHNIDLKVQTHHSALRISEKDDFKENIWTLKEGERWEIGPNRALLDIQVLRRKNVKLAKSLRLRWYGHAERIHNQRTPKQIATLAMEGTRKRGRPLKTLRHKVE